jgi:CBS domain-containing protein
MERRMRIEEIMSSPAVTCGINDSLNTAAQLMWEHDCGSLPVVNDEGCVVGMITDRDICMAAYTQGSSLHPVAVANAMAKEVFSCHLKDSLESAERLMRNKQIRRMPVLNDDNRPAGVLSFNDIARYAASSRKNKGIEHEVTQTLAAIGEPRPHVIQLENVRLQPAV